MGSFLTSLPFLWMPMTGADGPWLDLFSWLFLQQTFHLSRPALGHNLRRLQVGLLK